MFMPGRRFQASVCCRRFAELRSLGFLFALARRPWVVVQFFAHAAPLRPA